MSFHDVIEQFLLIVIPGLLLCLSNVFRSGKTS
jgi:hypothetical protein